MKEQVIQIGKYYPPAKGGMENYLELLVQEVCEEVPQKVLVSNTEWRSRREVRNGISVNRLGKYGEVSSVPFTPGLPWNLLKFSNSLLHFHLPNPWAVISYYLAGARAETIVTYHSDIIGRGKAFELYRPLQDAFLRRTKKIIATSPDYVESSLTLSRFRDKVEVIPLGIDLEKFNPSPEAMNNAERISKSYNRPLVLFIGRLAYYKGLETLLKAMEGAKAELVVIGSGPLGAELRELASSKLGLANVKFTGQLPFEDVLGYLYASDMFCLPSIERSEAFGIVQLEAMACRKPVISTNLDTGVPFVNQDGETGLVVPPEDEGSLREAINTLVDSPELREEYGKKGRKRVEKLFTKEKMAEETLQLYNEILS